jgi:hypothetical protein
MATHYCPQCGTETSNDDRFCPRCGADLEVGQGDTTVVARGEEAPRKFPLPLLLVILLGAALILAGLFLDGGEEEGQGVALATASPPSSQLPFPDASRIPLEEAKTLYDDEEATFVDVRDAESYAESHITGAVSVPLDGDNLDPAYESLATGARLITYCT